MPKEILTIINKRGLHARAAAKLARTAGNFSACVQVRIASSANEYPWADAKSVMSLMLLAAAQGTQIEVQANGDDEEQAMQTICALIADYFEEGE